MLWPGKYKLRSRGTTFVIAPFDGKYLTSNRMAVFALSLTVCEICAKQQKCRKFDLENEDQSHRLEERDLHHSTGNVEVHVIFLVFELMEIYIYAKGNRKRQGWRLKTKSGKQICLKTDLYYLLPANPCFGLSAPPVEVSTANEGSDAVKYVWFIEFLRRAQLYLETLVCSICAVSHPLWL